MTKNEFMDYLKYLQKALKIDVPTDKDVVAAWYESFKNIHIIVAKKMANLYLQKESGFFKLPKLLEYKSLAMAGATYEEPPKELCKICGNTGFVWIRPRHEGKYGNDVFKRCVCLDGGKIPGFVNQITQEDLDGMEKLGENSLIWIKEE